MADAPTASIKPIDKSEWTPAHARHLLWRAGFGGTPVQIAHLAAMEPKDAVSSLLDFEKVDADADTGPDGFDDAVMRPPTDEERRQIQNARRTQNEDVLARIRLAREQREQDDREQMRRIQRWWLRRMIETPRPMQEKLTLFWHGHFATSYRTIENSAHMLIQNRMLRANAAGNFGELLFAIIRDPAMIAYLDNNDSRAGQPNENLARELMELFSLGEGNYSEKDIKEGARALTGYTFDFNSFVFRRDWHDGGSKEILGATGSLDGDGFVRAILTQRAASQFICLKLYRFFVADLPEKNTPQYRAVVSVIKQLAGTLLESRYNIKPVLRRLLLSEHFYDPANRLARVKSPTELVVGAMRSLHTPVRDLGILTDAMDRMGQSLFFPPSVKGWDGGRSWINTSTLFVRANIMNFLLTGKTPTGHDPLAETQRYDPLHLLIDASERTAGAERQPRALAAYLLHFCLGIEPDSAQIDAIARYITERGGVNPDTIARALALITALPEYQQC